MKRSLLTFLCFVLICYSSYSQRLIRTLTGHQNAITSLCFSSNGAMIVSGSWDKTVRLWNPATGATSRIIETGKSILFSAALNKDAKYIATGSWSPDIYIYQSQSGDVIKTFVAHSFKTNFVVYSPDGKTLASVGIDTVKLWDATTYAQKFSLYPFTSDVNLAVFSPDSRSLATATYDGWIYLWNVADGTLIRKVKAHPSNIPSIVFSTDGKFLLSLCEDGTVNVWDANTFEPLTALKGLVRGGNSIDFSSDGKTLAIAGKDNTVCLADLWENKTVATLSQHVKPVNCVKFSPNGDMLATAGDDGTILLWDLSDLKYTKCLEEKMLPYDTLKRAKGEFETSEQYKKRMAEYQAKRAEMKKVCMNEDALLRIEEQAAKEDNTLSSYRYVTLNIQQISIYNADKQVYDIDIEGKTYTLKMPLQEAKTFKGVWKTASVKGIQRVSPVTGKVEYINMQVVHPLTNIAYMIGTQVLPSTDKYLKEFLNKNPQVW